MSGDEGKFEFVEVALTAADRRAQANAESQRRWRRRVQFSVLNEALVDFGIHSLSAQRMVREWAQTFFENRVYRYMFAITEPFVPATVTTFDEALLAQDSRLEVWIPQTGGYIAIGGQVLTEAADPIDGNRIAAKVTKGKLDIQELTIGGAYIPSDTLWLPGHGKHDQVGRLGARPCPTCGMVLPATGRCEYCE